MEEEFSATREQRCRVHKTANVLDKLPKKVQGSAKRMIHQMYMAPAKAAACLRATHRQALEAYGEFLALYGAEYPAKYPRACRCLQKDRDVLFTFYDFPAEHWARAAARGTSARRTRLRARSPRCGTGAGRRRDVARDRRAW